MKILLVEDDSRQVKYAQWTLGGHELIVCSCMHEAQDCYEISSRDECKLLKPFDLMVTDLVLPAGSRPGYEPGATIGLSLFRAGMQLLAQDKIKGVALVSNFEHHVNNREIDEDDQSQVAQLMELTQIFGKTIVRDGPGTFRLVRKSPKCWNVTVLFDLHVDDYLEVLSPTGELVNKQRVYKEFGTMKAANKAGYTLPKMFRLAVDGLLQD